MISETPTLNALVLPQYFDAMSAVAQSDGSRLLTLSRYRKAAAARVALHASPT